MTEKEKADYTARFGDQSNVIRLCFNASQTIGVGVEYVVVAPKTLFKLVDGAASKKQPVPGQGKRKAK